MNPPELTPWNLAWPRLQSASRIAFDLEGDFNLHRYGRKICLFQVALDDGSTFLLDPFEASEGPWDIEWKKLLENPLVTKVIWAAQNDVRALKACAGIHLKGLWDLFDAACLTVTPRPSLPLLVSTFLGQGIEKSEALQISDWNSRPLSTDQLTYAAQDVRFLLELADHLDPLLDAKKKREVFVQRMRTAEGYVFYEGPEPWRRVKGAGALVPDQLERLQTVWLHREILAKSLDLAPWRVVSSEELLHWAREGRFSEKAVVDPRWTSG